jgi:hypothetical protein
METKREKVARKKAEALVRAQVREEKKIADRNAKFRAMPLADQRVALAKEILQIIKPGKGTKMQRGNGYIESRFPEKTHRLLFKLREQNTNELRVDQRDPDWQQFLPKTKCTVCMLGVAALASIRLRDGAPLRQFGRISSLFSGESNTTFGQGECINLLSDLFAEDELHAMEQFFEYRSGGISAVKSVEVLWGTILKNKGQFDQRLLAEAYKKALKRKK